MTGYRQEQGQCILTSKARYRRSYLKPFVLDSVFQTAHYVQVPVWIKVSKITSLKPAILFSACILIIQVTCEEAISNIHTQVRDIVWNAS